MPPAVAAKLNKVKDLTFEALLKEERVRALVNRKPFTAADKVEVAGDLFDAEQALGEAIGIAVGLPDNINGKAPSQLVLKLGGARAIDREFHLHYRITLLDFAIANKRTVIKIIYSIVPRPKPPTVHPEGDFETWTAGPTANNVCIYLTGPAAQTGDVTLNGPASGLPQTKVFTLDNEGAAMVPFSVDSAATFTFQLRRKQADGTFKTKQGSVTVGQTGTGPAPPPGSNPPACPAPR